eukprot:TRINITY_DN1375_c0_g1_i2.p1 TRINITY_DN1375_c0_g1~~TRINITY_DN1375_c0_g1_i2.p1  ORF type:complete len:256 (-),score=57.50 TRINITY_DN1375_c0_g1_i2:1129-1896(-)
MKVEKGKPPPYTGMVDCAMQTVRKEGPLGLYKGIGPPLAGIGFLYAVVFAGYGAGKSLVRKGDQPDTDFSGAQYFTAGCVSGVITTAMMVPMEQIKIRLQVDTEGKYKGSVDCFKAIYREGGIRSAYRGAVLTLWRDVPGSGAYFAAYELMRRKMIPEGGTANDLNFWQVLLAGGSAGICNWLIALPADTLKSRYQTAPIGTYSGSMDCLKQLIKNDGPQALFRGFTPIMVRAFPANAATFLGFELAFKFLNWAF